MISLISQKTERGNRSFPGLIDLRSVDDNSMKMTSRQLAACVWSLGERLGLDMKLWELSQHN